MRTSSDLTRSFRFSTGDVPRRARAAAVRDLHERGLIPLEPLPGHAAHVDIGTWFLPGLGIMSGALAGLRQEAGAHAVAASDDLFIGVNVTGYSCATQRGQEITVKRGEAVLVTAAAGPFTITRPTPVRFLGVRVPRGAIAPLVRGHDHIAMRAIPSTTEPLKLLTAYARAVLDTEMLASPSTCRLIVTHLHDLVALTLGPTRDTVVAAERGGVRAARLQAIKADIAANFSDESLTLPALAARHGVTARYVHRLFESEGISYGRFVLRQRLECAHRKLGDPRWVGRSISSIAYDVGFSDLSYFNRAFRRFYQATPSDVRHSLVARSTSGEVRMPRG